LDDPKGQPIERVWGAVVLAAIAGVVAMFLPAVETTAVSWAGAKGDDWVEVKDSGARGFALPAGFEWSLR
jgi:hypothetical protein